MITEGDYDQVFHALAHEVRRRIMDELQQRPGINVGELAQGFDVSRIAIMNHLAVLEKAGLLMSEKQGRTRKLFLNVAPLQLIRERWMDGVSEYWAGRITGLKYAAEAAAQTKKGLKDE